jgi:hypothetical protein
LRAEVAPQGAAFSLRGLRAGGASNLARRTPRLPSLTMVGTAERGDDGSAVCRACGACCSYSPEWPRFSLEDDSQIERIPAVFRDGAGARMLCHGDRCAALLGDVGLSTSCAVYEMRPDVCRACVPGDDACQMARRRFNL